MLYVSFNEEGFMEGLFNTDISPRPTDKETFILTERLRDEIANVEVTTMVRADNLTDTSIIYDDINLILKPNLNQKVIIVEENIDAEKLAMAEAIADLYERLAAMKGEL